MVKLVHDDVIIKLRRSFCGEVLRVESLNRNKQIIDTLRLVTAHKHLTEVGILQHSPEGVHALLEDFLPVRNKEQAAGLARMLLAEPLVIQGGNDGFAGACGSYNQIAVVTANFSFRLQFVQYLLLIGVWCNIHCVYFGMIGAEILFSVQRPGKTLLLILRIIFKFIGVPVALKGSRNFGDGLRQVFLRDLHVPLQTAGNSCIGKVGRADISCCEARITVEHIGFGVQPRALGVIADLDFRIGQLTKLLNRLYIGSAHIGSCNNAQLAAVLRKLPKLIHQKAQAAPLDEGHQNVDTVSGYDFLFEFRVHLRLMDGAGEQRTLGNGGLRAAQVGSGFAHSQPGIGFPQKRKKLLCPLVNTQRGKVSFFCCVLDEGYNLIGQRNLGRDIPAVIHHIVQTFLNHICQILRQHLGCFCLVNGCNSLAGFRDFRKLAV